MEHVTLGDIASVFTALAALGALFVSWHNSRKIAEIHVDINGKMDKFLALTRASAKAEGMLEAQTQVAKQIITLKD